MENQTHVRCCLNWMETSVIIGSFKIYNMNCKLRKVIKLKSMPNISNYWVLQKAVGTLLVLHCRQQFCSLRTTRFIHWRLNLIGILYSFQSDNEFNVWGITPKFCTSNNRFCACWLISVALRQLDGEVLFFKSLGWPVGSRGRSSDSGWTITSG